LFRKIEPFVLSHAQMQLPPTLVCCSVQAILSYSTSAFLVLYTIHAVGASREVLLVPPLPCSPAPPLLCSSALRSSLSAIEQAVAWRARHPFRFTNPSPSIANY
jgi:hypothetical protein